MKNLQIFNVLRYNQNIDNKINLLVDNKKNPWKIYT